MILDRRAREAFERALDGLDAVPIEACVRCGLCGTSCHVWLADPVPDNLPGMKLRRVGSLWRRRHTLAGRWLPRAVGASEATEETLAALVEAVYGRCTGCGRCGLHCSVGLDIAEVISGARRALSSAGLAPEELRRTLDAQLRTGNQMGVTAESFVETAEWLSEDLAARFGAPEARVRVDEAGSRVLYLVNPREVQFFPLSLQAAAALFHAAGESWTLSSRVFDVTNYGLFAGDTEAAKELVARALEEARRLGASEIVLSECGHGFRALRWEGPSWLGRSHPIPVRSVLELLDEWIASGRITVDRSLQPVPTTLHDPCNLVRWGGIVEPQRRVLERCVEHFVEMSPNREKNWCCGGGGGLLSIGEHGRRRLASGRKKIEQIRATGAGVVACPCHNCADQLLELTRVEDLGVEIRSVVEIASDALVVSKG